MGSYSNCGWKMEAPVNLALPPLQSWVGVLTLVVICEGRKELEQGEEEERQGIDGCQDTGKREEKKDRRKIPKVAATSKRWLHLPSLQQLCYGIWPSHQFSLLSSHSEIVPMINVQTSNFCPLVVYSPLFVLNQSIHHSVALWPVFWFLVVWCWLKNKFHSTRFCSLFYHRYHQRKKFSVKFKNNQALSHFYLH